MDFVFPAPSSGGSGAPDVIVCALQDPQVDTSCVGKTYTDVTGNTYAELSGQTRITLSSTRTNGVACRVSAHVNAGTGTIELYNFTDGTSLGTVTTTATSETLLAAITSTAATNKGDAITIRVKNSGAGNTITIDMGGMLSGDASMVSPTAVAMPTAGQSGGYVTSWKFAVLKCTTATTFTIQPVQGSGGNGTTLETNALGSTFSQTAHGTVLTRTPLYKLYGGGLSFDITACSGTGLIVSSYEMKAAAI